MKKIIAFTGISEKLVEKNFLFNNACLKLGEDLLKPLQELKNVLESSGKYVLATIDTVNLSDVSLIVFLEIPSKLNEYYIYARDNNIPTFVLIGEAYGIYNENCNFERYKEFTKVFSFDDKAVKEHNCIKLNYSFCFPKNLDKELSQKTKLCTMIASNKTVNHKNELYSKRLQVIKWFEKNAPSDFELYGYGWDIPYYFHGSKLKRIFNHSDFFRCLLSRQLKTYKGIILNKRDTLKKYKFSFCYENFSRIEWITEKIFDSFIAGCVPVYLGADNIADHIPENCFIDKRKFSNYISLYHYLKKMKDGEYLNYLDNIEAFIKSPGIKPFTIDYFIETLLSEIIKII